jgi:hypothetical protein
MYVCLFAPVNGYDAWWLYDASRLPPPTIASEEAGILTVLDDDLFHGIQQNIKK